MTDHRDPNAITGGNPVRVTERDCRRQTRSGYATTDPGLARSSRRLGPRFTGEPTPSAPGDVNVNGTMENADGGAGPGGEGGKGETAERGIRTK